MIKDLIHPAATIAVELLRREQTGNFRLTDDVIAAAFEQAYRCLEQSQKRISERDAMDDRYGLNR